MGDTFKYVFNEQVVANGAITVNADHQYLLGPTAVGEFIIGQSRCATTAATFPTTTVAAGSNGGAAATAAPAGGLAKTGRTTGWLVALGLTLIYGGLTATRLGRRRLRASADER